ncbi:MAG: type II secretion system protein [Planctomycetes bacterium]|nr:type II secretion system protein [Planctomycetota bacterium]
MSLHRPRRRRSGHTLVEMVIVGMIVALVATFATRAWNPIGDSIVGLRERATASSELRLAVEYLREDFGGAAEVAEETGEKLLIRREAAVAFVAGVPSGTADPGIRYWLDEDRLVRRDLWSRDEFVVARKVGSFQITRFHGIEYRVALTAGADSDQRTITLAWVQ